ncbi:MAG: serine/threonine protein kinase [Deltaproteobacteria bacterium]|nr:serine/threonine protein kinase [Deltaproteobacteria bacterium]MBN2670988.1 serine/threonine protein kinase [Deltaproteobacteria bacterium]
MSFEHLTPTEVPEAIESIASSRIIRAGADRLQGQILNGKYRLTSILSKGGAGSVYLARNVESGSLVAIKILRSDLNLVPRVRERFLTESRAAARIRHPAVVHAIELGETAEGALFFVMDYVPGPPLRKLLNSHTLTIQQSVLIAAATAEGLKAAHTQDVVHRDLKPENILIPRNKNAGSVVKIVDFGIARLLNTPRITTTEHILGTPSYLSPEQAEGLSIDRRTDIYSLGIIMYEMLTGSVPFQGDTTEELLDAQIRRIPTPIHNRVLKPLPHPLEQLVMGCLQKNPDHRPNSMDEVLAILSIV